MYWRPEGSCCTETRPNCRTTPGCRRPIWATCREADDMTMERVLWFDGRIRAGSHPSSADLAGRFKVSLRTAQRDIEFLRDRLQAPLRYEPAAKGYAYGDPGFFLPQAFFRKDEI